MKASAIIPAYNVDNSIRRCLESVLAQTYDDVEIIVVDDGSTDDTAEIVQSFGDQVRFIQQENSGQSVARNRGIESSTGDFIGFLDADDYWEPEFFEQTIGFLNSHPDLDAVLTAWTKIVDTSRSEVVPPLMDRDQPADGFEIDSFYKFWVEQNHIQTGAILLRRSLVERGGLMLPELRVSQDLEYWGYLANFGKWGFLPVPLFVSNSRLASRGRWISKYRGRRRLCPTIHQWESRIKETVAPDDWPFYEIIRGRVAAGYVHMMVNGHRDQDAMETVREFGDQMPSGRIAQWLRFAAQQGGLTWKLLCSLIRMKEQIKGLVYSLTSSS
ncbi:MAG: glycosyltransferase [Planctomycetota bacterium]